MKPKDLICPYTHHGYGVYLDLEQRILFVPARTNRPQIRLNFDEIFENTGELHLEFCSGNGEWIINQALAYPDTNWIALEMRFDRVRKIWSKMKNHKIKNLFIFCGEAKDICEHYLQNEAIDTVSINFPDPWPKARHAKHRLIQAPFVKELYRILKSAGSVQTLTDDPPYFEQIRDTFLTDSGFESVMGPPYYDNNIDSYGPSFFMRLWLEKKRSFYFSKFKKSAYMDKD